MMTTTTLRRTPTKARSKVQHYYWLNNGKAAQEMNVDVRYLCGHWGSPPNSHVNVPMGLTESGVIVAVPESRDCLRCLAAVNRAWCDAQRRAK